MTNTGSMVRTLRSYTITLAPPLAGSKAGKTIFESSGLNEVQARTYAISDASARLANRELRRTGAFICMAAALS